MPATTLKPELLVLGTAAAEGIPAVFCDCRVCRAAAARGGHDVRARTSYNFGGVLQIDIGPDFLQAWRDHRDTLSQMRHILITHAHNDHLRVSELAYRAPGFSNVPIPDGIVTIHGTRPTLDFIRRGFSSAPEADISDTLARCRLAFHTIQQFDAFALPDCGAYVRAFKADHDRRLDPCIFVLTLNGRSVLICNDTGFLPEETWDALSALRGEVTLDVAVLDNTGMLRGIPGAPEGELMRGNHMSAPTVLQTFERLDSLGILGPNCIRAVNHFSHNGGSTHDELCAFYEPRGIVVCHDGLAL